MTYFDTTFDGEHPSALSTIYQSSGRVLSTTESCQLSTEMAEYGSISGTLQFAVVFDAGARHVTINAGKYRETAINTIIFNSDFVQTVEFL